MTESKKLLNKHRGLLLKLLLLFSSVFATTLVLEIVLRFVYRDGYFGFHTDPNVRASKEFKYHVYKNSWKIRDREFTEEDLKKKKILFLGDSMLYGIGVEIEQTFAKVLETKLKDAGSDLITINAGKVNTGTRAQLDLLLKLEERTSFDVVCFVFYLGNDSDNNYRDEVLKKKNRNVREGAHSSLGGLTEFLARNSILYNFVYYNVKATAYSIGLIESFQGRNVLLKDYGEQARMGWDVTSDVIGEIKAHFDSKPDSKVFFLILPADFQVDKEKQELYGLTQTDYDFDKPNRILQGQLEEHGIPYLDVTNALRERYETDPEDRHYFELDRHLNSKGHQLVCSLLLKYTRARGLIP